MLALTPAHSDDGTTSFGVGAASCANWKFSPGNDFEGKAWILGFWSGLNVASRNHSVGDNTDGPAILAEVALICKAKPSITLQKAVIDHYLVVAKNADLAPRKITPQTSR